MTIRLQTANYQSGMAILNQGLSQLQNTNESYMVSPYSYNVVASMLIAGARGETAREYAEHLGFGSNQAEIMQAVAEMGDHYESLLNTADLNRQTGGAELSIGNAFYVQDGMPLNQTLSELLADKFRTEIKDADFVKQPDVEQQRINQDINDQTNGFVPKLIPDGIINGLTRFVLTNAGYFKGQWKYKFDDSQTIDDGFTLPDGENINVPTMNLPRGVEAKILIRGDDLKEVIELPYLGDDWAFYAIRPGQNYQFGEIGAYMAAFDKIKLELAQGTALASALDFSQGAFEMETSIISIPKFELRAQTDLKAILMGLGVTDIFSDSADLSGFIDQSHPVAQKYAGLQITDFLQEVKLNVNEEGSEGGFATAAVGGFESVPMGIYLNRPFLFAIRSKLTGAIMFMGQQMDPRTTEVTVK